MLFSMPEMDFFTSSNRQNPRKVSGTITGNSSVQKQILIYFDPYISLAALGGRVVSVLATGPLVVGSGLTKDGGFLWMIKICSVHLLWREVMLLVPHVKEHYRA
jgi:hypothetical protein